MALDQAAQKAAAAVRAAMEVQPGMVVGLGSGSTAALVVESLGARLRDGLRFVGVPTSDATREQAIRLGIPLTTLDDHPELDLDIDGADEVDPRGEMIKGLGGALLREKIVASAARRLLIVVDEGKNVPQLGLRAPVPVEVVRFGWRATAARLQAWGATAELRGGGHGPFVTDGGNYILDCRFAGGIDLAQLASAIKSVLGVVEHGLFVGLRPTVITGRADGSCSVHAF